MPDRPGRAGSECGAEGCGDDGRSFEPGRRAVAAQAARVVGRRGRRGLVAARSGPAGQRLRGLGTAARLPGRDRRVSARLRELGR
ncbi:hypothetical protein SGPA1_21972 [Streptomyces misionensis JCM 4497]